MSSYLDTAVVSSLLDTRLTPGLVRQGQAEAGEAGGQGDRAPPHPAHRIADGGNPVAHRLDGEGGRVDVADLVPAKRRGDACVRHGPDRVRAGDRPVARVLAEVDEDAL